LNFGESQLPETPNALDLAADHVQFKRTKLAKAKRRAKTRLQAMRYLKLSRDAEGRP
jgi:hypothetical protein